VLHPDALGRQRREHPSQARPHRCGVARRQGRDRRQGGLDPLSSPAAGI
jgi:hypothetical protein